MPTKKKICCLLLILSNLCFHPITRAETNVRFDSESELIDYLDHIMTRAKYSPVELTNQLQALKTLSVDKGWDLAEVNANLWLVDVMLELHNHNKASSLLEQTVDAFPQHMDNVSIKTRVLLNKILLATDTGSSEQIRVLIKQIQESIQAFELLEEHAELSAIFKVLGRAYSELQDFSNAIRSYQRAYQESQAAGDTIAATSTLLALGVAYMKMNDNDKALQHFSTVLDLERTNGNLFVESVVLFNMSIALMQNDELERAKHVMTDSLKIVTALNDKVGIYWSKQILAEIAFKQTDYQTALDLYQASYQFFAEQNDNELMYNAINGMIETLIRLHDAKQAWYWFQQYTPIYQKIATPELDLKRSLQIAELHALDGNHKSAYSSLKQAFSTQQNLSQQRIEQSAEKFQALFETQLQEEKNVRLTAKNAQQNQYIEQQEQRQRTLILLSLAIVACLAWSIFVLRKQYRLRQQFKKMALIDPLTGQPNRRSIMEFAETALTKAVANKEWLVIAIIDLDFFKSINDQFGHDTGDNVLKVFGGACKKVLTQKAGFGRYGGEEFLLVMRNCRDSDLPNAFENLRKDVNKEQIQGLPKDRDVTFSMGACKLIPNASHSLQSLINLADEQLYLAKETGRDCLKVKDYSSSTP